MRENKALVSGKNAEGTLGYAVKMVLVITLICVFIALLLSVVNGLTKDVIEQNEINERQRAILALFESSDGNDAERSVMEYTAEDGTVVYAVAEDDLLMGYCIPATGTGFGGEISAMIGFNADGRVNGVKIISMSETPGVGTKVKADSFLSRFFGKNDTVEIGGDVDGITGATFSSKGVAEAVNNALSVRFEVDEMASALGLRQ